MRRRPNMKTTKKQIVDWCQENIEECGYPVDGEVMNTHCFRCGYERHTERAHTVHWSTLNFDEKYDSPEYYRLLCSECHEEAPNIGQDEYIDWPYRHFVKMERECISEMDKWIIESAKKFNPHLYYNVYWVFRDKIAEISSKLGTHGFNGLNQATLEWAEKQFWDWYEEWEEHRIYDYLLKEIEKLKKVLDISCKS